MTETQEKAIKRIAADYNTDKLGRYAAAIASAVRDQILDFCRQEEEFADFVLSSDHTITDCIKHVGKKIQGKKSISDMEVYAQAVAFYFPTAKIQMKLTLDLAGNAETFQRHVYDKPAGRVIDLTFDDLFGGV